VEAAGGNDSIMESEADAIETADVVKTMIFNVDRTDKDNECETTSMEYSRNSSRER